MSCHPQPLAPSSQSAVAPFPPVKLPNSEIPHPPSPEPPSAVAPPLDPPSNVVLPPPPVDLLLVALLPAALSRPTDCNPFSFDLTTFAADGVVTMASVSQSRLRNLRHRWFPSSAWITTKGRGPKPSPLPQ
ncbi:hypothetical protein TIFTF001_035767 [Ficus carica]|uniref:Uncharacterized protein n=1 Tax=Ficus carica TaxID=3494 RepID=A0AA88E400_FICCA|nr:hypothetical protein TIFTF001_041464 [Ficus carica]GMN66703.1 hypothetical protein TIFTF001_035767 [Ficus carica]